MERTPSRSAISAVAKDDGGARCVRIAEKAPRYDHAVDGAGTRKSVHRDPFLVGKYSVIWRLIDHDGRREGLAAPLTHENCAIDKIGISGCISAEVNIIAEIKRHDRISRPIIRPAG